MSKTSIFLPILRYNEAGILVGTYKRLTNLMSECGIGYYKLEKVLVTGELYKGFTYKPAKQLPESLVLKILSRGGGQIEPGWEPHWTSQQPWEGNDGFFDIKGWSKSIY